MQRRQLKLRAAAVLAALATFGSLAAAPAWTEKVKLATSMGDIVLELDSAKAPKTVDNFLKYVAAGQYDGTVFHRVIDGFMVQGGGFEPGMKQKQTNPPIRNEATNGLKNRKYTLAMARTEIGRAHV